MNVKFKGVYWYKIKKNDKKSLIFDFISAKKAQRVFVVTNINVLKLGICIRKFKNEKIKDWI